MIRKTLAIVLTVLIVPLAVSGPFGQQINDKSPVIGSDHDTKAGGNGCLNCHVPHQSSQRGRTLLWVPAFSTQTFGTYDTGTMDSKTAEVGDSTYGDTNPPTGAKMRTVLCLSCHDGVTSPTLIGPTDGAAVGNPTNADGLRNDHPVNMAHDPTADTGLVAIATVQATNVRLFTEGTDETVQCSSCHDAHNGPGIGEFLRVSNASSGLCVTCHK